MSWRVRALVGDKKRTCKVVHSTSVREPVGCFELLIDVDKTPAQPVSGKQHLRFLHGIARSSGCCCTYNISCLGIPKFVWARHDTNQTLYLCSRKPSYKSLIVEGSSLQRFSCRDRALSGLYLTAHLPCLSRVCGRRKKRGTLYKAHSNGMTSLLIVKRPRPRLVHLTITAELIFPGCRAFYVPHAREGADEYGR